MSELYEAIPVAVLREIEGGTSVIQAELRPQNRKNKQGVA